LKQQQHNISSNFGIQQVVVGALVAALAMALGEQWQQSGRLQSTIKQQQL
jgi:hypothetical protein